MQKGTETQSAFEEYSGPTWNNSSEYPSMASNEFAHDRADIETLISQITAKVRTLKPLMERTLTQGSTALSSEETRQLVSDLQSMCELNEQASIILRNLMTYVNCESSIDGKNTEAQKVWSELMTTAAQLENAAKPAWLFLDRAPDEILNGFLQHLHTKPYEFSLQQSRRLKDTLLSESEETLLSSMKLHGPAAWGNLYDQISGGLRCQVTKPDGTTEELGLAQAAGLIRDTNEPLRKSAWQGIQNAWKSYEQPCAAILNSLAGWRLEEYKRRSHTRPVDFLDHPLHSSRIRKETLEAMLSAIQSEIETPRRALRALARGLGKNQMDPWDLLAPAPAGGSGARRPFKEGLSIIRDAFDGIDTSFGDFVDTMEKNRWLEGRILPTKRQGAYCTGFAKSRTPRVFQTYMGSISDIRTLAHELGHAYHGWVMRDLPLAQHRYPMTLAETASVFAETVFANHMFTKGDEHARFEIAWQNAESAAGFLLNIPARFEFEKKFYERRKKSFVSPEELNQITEAAWRNWYGDTISQPESQFWMTKLHFSISGISFYNFPYSFGYLFSLGIYAQKERLGSTFLNSYIALLRDTGRMTAEELVQTHLGEDITKPEFWKKSLKIVEEQVSLFEELLAKREPVRLRQ